jgi:hypothetical protein
LLRTFKIVNNSSFRLFCQLLMAVGTQGEYQAAEAAEAAEAADYSREHRADNGASCPLNG